MARTELIRLRVTPEEKAEIERAAHEAGMSLSEFVRLNVVVEQKTPVKHVVIPDRDSHFRPDPK